AYQQNNQSSIIFASANQENQEQISKLQTELTHYQTLYQKRVEKDLNGRTSYDEYQEMEQQNKDLLTFLKDEMGSENIADLRSKLNGQNLEEILRESEELKKELLKKPPGR